jgi:hypothetical protein
VPLIVKTLMASRTGTIRSTHATVPASSRTARLKPLSQPGAIAQSASIDDIPSSRNAKETHHERSSAKHLPLYQLPWPDLYLWLPASRYATSLCLWPAVQMRPGVRLPQGLKPNRLRDCDLVVVPEAPFKPSKQECVMNRLLQILMTLINRKNGPGADERYLARSIDAHDFEVRLQALERRPA